MKKRCLTYKEVLGLRAIQRKENSAKKTKYSQYLTDVKGKDEDYKNFEYPIKNISIIKEDLKKIQKTYYDKKHLIK